MFFVLTINVGYNFSVPNKRFAGFYRGFVGIERTTGDQSAKASCFSFHDDVICYGNA